MRRRIIAGMLAAILVFSNMSVSAFASTTSGTTPESGIVSEVVSNQEETGSASVSGNVIDTEDEENSSSETESTVEESASETESTDAENGTEESGSEETVTEEAATEEATTEEMETETETAEEIEAGLERSMTESFLVDTTAPYDGDYLLIANTNTSTAGGYEATGTFPSSDIVAAAMYSENVNNIYGISTEDIYGYDNWGRGLIDPASRLPELKVSENTSNSVAPLKEETASVTPYAVGNTKVFYLDNNNEVDEYGYDVCKPVTCICVAIGIHSTVWVPADDPIYVKSASQMQAYMSTLATEFDTQYSKMVEMFGDASALDAAYGDADGKVALVCYDIDGNEMSSNSYVAGYFFAADTSFPFSNATGSNCDMLHIDSWQGMDRDTTNLVLNDVTASKGTVVHEFQHMINFAVNRANDPALYTVKTPDYINEAFSMAAEHLCYGPDECSDRVWYYNYYPYIARGDVSLMRWGAYDTLSSYSLSYLFGQYIRTQYKNGDTIYRDAMNQYDNSSENLLTIIAELLEITEQELLLNFRIALFQKNAEGPYGFKGEEWAEDIRQSWPEEVRDYYVTGNARSLYPGAAIIVPSDGNHTPSGAGINISFAGMYVDLTDEDVEVNISGGSSISKANGTLQLTASVYPAGVSQSVIFTLPKESDKAFAKVTTDGLVTALANGQVTVRATSVYNPDKYADVVITITGQPQVAVRKTEEVLDEGYFLDYTATNPTSAKLYYTYAYVGLNEYGNLDELDPDTVADPTTESDLFPEEGLMLTEAGTHVIKVLGTAEGYEDCLLTATYEIDQLPTPFIWEEQNEDGTYTVTLQAVEGATIAYTVDGSIPTRPATDATLYTGPFQVTEPGWREINVIAYKPGNVTSECAYKCLEVPVATPEIVVENVLGGKEVTLNTATKGADIYYTLDGSEPDENATLYKDVLLFDKEDEITIKAIAVVENRLVNYEIVDENGDVYIVEDEFDTSSATATETITIGKTKTVVSSQTSNVLEKGDIVSLYSPTADSYIYYTLDESNPAESATSKLYQNYITMGNNTLRIRTYARSYGNEDSEIVEYVYALYGVVTEIALEPENVTLYGNVEGSDATQLTASIQPEGITAEQLQWKSSNTGVVTVDETGKLTAVAPGTATITAYSGNVSGTCTVTVKNAIESMELLNDSLVIKEDQGTLKLETSVYPANAAKEFSYTVEMSDRNEDAQGVARVDADGVLTAIKSGVVKVTIEPKENVKNAAPVIAYVTISNQRSYNSTYRPRLSESSITLNKKAIEGAFINIYSLGNGTSVTNVVFDTENRYAQYFSIEKDTDGAYEVLFTELGKTSLRNGTYRVPVVIESEIALDNICYTDTFTQTLKIQVKNSAPKISVNSLRVNRYYSNLEYPLTIRSAVEDFEILDLADADDTNTFTNNFTIESGEETKLVLNQSINHIEEYKDRLSIKGYVRVQAAGFEEQLVPLTIYIQNTAPDLVVDGGRKLLNYQAFMETPEMTVALSEKTSRAKTVSLTGIQSVALDVESSYYQTASNVISSLTTDGSNITLSWNTNEIKVKTYYIPLLVTTEDYVDVPVTVEVALQRESVIPKVKLESTILMLNRNYPDETASTGVSSVSQANVTLTDFEITPCKETLFANKDTAVLLDYADGKLVASIVGEPECSTYMFTCVPQFTNGIVSDQEITVTVKLHEKQAAVSVTSNGSIDVLRRDDTAVVYTVNKINFTDDFEEVNLIEPERTSSSVYDGSDAFTFTYDEEKGTITVKAKADYKFVKGKKYAFRFELVKQCGFDGNDRRAARVLLTDDLSIQPTQSAVRFTVDQIPALFRYVSSANNTQPVNLRSNVGTIQSVEVKSNHPLPEGITIQGTNTLETICYDGVEYYSIQPGSYTCYLNVYIEGQMYREVDGELVQEPISCRVKYTVY